VQYGGAQGKPGLGVLPVDVPGCGQQAGTDLVGSNVVVQQQPGHGQAIAHQQCRCDQCDAGRPGADVLLGRLVQSLPVALLPG